MLGQSYRQAERAGTSLATVLYCCLDLPVAQVRSSNQQKPIHLTCSYITENTCMCPSVITHSLFGLQNWRPHASTVLYQYVLAISHVGCMACEFVVEDVYDLWWIIHACYICFYYWRVGLCHCPAVHNVYQRNVPVAINESDRLCGNWTTTPDEADFGNVTVKNFWQECIQRHSLVALRIGLEWTIRYVGIRIQYLPPNLALSKRTSIPLAKRTGSVAF